MEKEEYFGFLQTWEQIMWLLFYVSFGISLLIFFFYKIKYVAANEPKKKYDLASESESKAYLRSQYVMAMALFFLANTTYSETVQLSFIWIFIRGFISFCLATLYGYIAFLIFKYYYPKSLNKKLQVLRYTPRINPKTGNRMKLLSEDEEDAYLDEGMQAEENVFSIDYDVWIDPKTEDVRIEKYKGHLAALECDRCGFQTLRLVKEEIIEEASEFHDGEIEKEYKCSYCNRIKRKKVKLSKKVRQDTSRGRLIDDPLKYDRRIDVIKLEIHNNKGDIKNFEFQNIDQAKKFLEEFDFDKIDHED